MKPSTQPCPGCGRKGLYRNASQACGDCKQLIKEGKARRAELARLKETEAVKLPFGEHCLPYIYHFRTPFADYDPEAEVKAFVFALVKLLGTEVQRNHPQVKLRAATINDSGYVVQGKSGCESGGSYWLVPLGLEKLINSLYEAIIKGSGNAYEEGKEVGHNLIMGLATGETSIDDYNKATVGRVANKRPRKRRG